MSGHGGMCVAARQGGFSILETLIAIVVLSLVAGFLMTNGRTAAKGNRQSKVYGDAATATKEAMEAVRLMDLDAVSALKNTPIPHSQAKGIRVTATGRSLTAGDVADLNAQDTTSLRMVTVVTRFPGASGAEVSKTFTSLIYKP